MNRVALADVVGHAERNGIYRLEGDAPLAIRIAGRDLTGKPAMLAALAAAFAFPEWFGHNWDALADCLTDLAWLDGPVVLLVENAGVPEAAAPEAWDVLLDILADAARHWQAEGRPFAVLLEGGNAAYPALSVCAARGGTGAR